MPVFLPDIFGSYLTGRRAAVQDNWTDLSNYNQVLHGQLQNAYNMATFDPKVRAQWLAGQSAQLATLNDAVNAQSNLQGYGASNNYNLYDLDARAKASQYRVVPDLMAIQLAGAQLGLDSGRLALQQQRDAVRLGYNPYLVKQGLQSGVVQSDPTQPQPGAAPPAVTRPGSPYDPNKQE